MFLFKMFSPQLPKLEIIKAQAHLNNLRFSIVIMIQSPNIIHHEGQEICNKLKTSLRCREDLPSRLEVARLRSNDALNGIFVTIRY